MRVWPELATFKAWMSEFFFSVILTFSSFCSSVRRASSSSSAFSNAYLKIFSKDLIFLVAFSMESCWNLRRNLVLRSTPSILFCMNDWSLLIFLLRMFSVSFTLSTTTSSPASPEFEQFTLMMYFYPLKISLRSKSHAWSLIRMTYSLRPDSSASSVTEPKVSPMIAMSMFMKTTEIMNVANKNMDKAMYLS